MRYSVNVDAPWLDVTPAGGSVQSEPAEITLSGQTAGLKAGTYPTTIVVSSPEAINSPQEISVLLTIQTVGPDLDGDADVDQEDFGHLQACLSGQGIAQIDPVCMNARLDADLDVDADDVSIFLGCFSGPGQPPPPGCFD